MDLKAQPTVLFIGNDSALSYLLGRFAERSGYRLTAGLENLSAGDITVIDPTVIIFQSTELLETSQALVGELISLDAPIMVCSAVGDESRARELGADYCLTHPLTYDGFQTALVGASLSKQA